MKVYILRHGLAGSSGSKRYPRDSERPLTLRGRKKTRSIANGLKELNVSFTALLTSPYVRARQTAEIVAEVLKKKTILADELVPDGDGAELIARLNRNHANAEAVMLVGHEPYLSHLISVLITGKPGLPIELKKGGLCRLEADRLNHGRCAVLECLLTPRQIIRAGKP